MRLSIWRILLITAILAGLWSCKKPPPKTIPITEELVLSKDAFQNYFNTRFDFTTELVCYEKLPLLDTVKSIYSNRNNKTYWWNILSGDSASMAEAEAIFLHSQYHGLDMRYYYWPLVKYYQSELDKIGDADSAYQLMSELELILSASYLRMFSDVSNGRTKPEDVYGYTYMLPRNNYKEINYKRFLRSKRKQKLIDDVHQHDTTYQELLKVLHYYQSKTEELTSTLIDFTAYPKIELGDTVDVLPQVIQRLKIRNLPDSSIHQIPDTTIYTRALFNKIKLLQEKYQLTPDGIMGYKTYRLINTTPTDKIDQVRANLERQRWFTNRAEEPPYVYVNLPQYRVTLHWPDSFRSMKVCIGKNLPDNYDAMVKEYTDSGWLHKLPRNMETPQIASRFTYLVVNPTWTVPYSIIRREMWWSMVRDPGYLRRKNYKVYRGKTEVFPDTIQWSRIPRNRIPYTIVEQPGKSNSLGLVKYMFSNPFSIYLHDTPHKKAFERTQRAVSHGCVRLEDPILFGEFIMQGSKEYNADDFRILMGYAPKDEERLEEYDPLDSTAAIQPLDTTTKIRLQEPIPLYLDYRTVYYDEEWKLHFCYDIYDQNKLIWRAMDEM